jgi:hypothetical protein
MRDGIVDTLVVAADRDLSDAVEELSGLGISIEAVQMEE